MDYSENDQDNQCCNKTPVNGAGKQAYKSAERKKLLLSIAVTLIVMVIEVAGGILSNSIALLSDAGHMFTHLFALAVSYVAIMLAAMRPLYHRTFGFYRAEVIASLVNSLFLFAVTALIIYESVNRLLAPEPVKAAEMLLIGCIGLAVNILTIWILEGSRHHDRNIRSALMHMISDALSSVAVVVGATVMYFTGISIVDPLMGLLISLLIGIWAWKLLVDSIRVLLEIAPKNMPPHQIRKLLRENDPRIVAITDLHIVEITSGMYTLSAHVTVHGESLTEANDVIAGINRLLMERYSIDHTTIQVEKHGGAGAGLLPQ